MKLSISAVTCLVVSAYAVPVTNEHELVKKDEPAKQGSNSSNIEVIANKETPSDYVPAANPPKDAEVGVNAVGEKSSSNPFFVWDMLFAHKLFRDQHDAPVIEWDDALYQRAQSWADQCKFQHQEAGENLAYRSGDTPYWGEFVNMWGSERKFYNFDDPKFSAATGHFTQVVWKTSSKLGCAYSKCDFGTYVVCKYGPPGNWRGQYKDKVGRLINGTLDDLYVPYWLQPKDPK